MTFANSERSWRRRGPLLSGSGKRFRCIALDAVGTLIYSEPSVAAVYALYGQHFGSQLTAAAVRLRLADAFCRTDELATKKFGEPGRTNEEFERHFWRQVVQDVLPDVTEPSACFDALFEHFGRPESWRCFDDVASTLKELLNRGYRILIASNFDARLNRVCDGLSELRDVRCRVISSLVGFRKTHRGFYTAVVEAAECEPGEVLMVGDDLVNDVESARAAGITAVHLRREFVVPTAGDSMQSTVDENRLDGELRALSELLEMLP